MSSLIVEVVKISDVLPHPNADRLDLVTVKGWQCIVGRDEYKKGDEVVFIPPDSILPGPMIEHYKVNYLKNNLGRVGTVKLRGEYSEGLILPNDGKYRLGTNVAEFLGITKWEPAPVSTAGKNTHKYDRSRRGVVPENLFRKYTDIENIKNFPGVLEDGEMVAITEKIHGTNFRFGYVHGGKGLRGWINKLLGKPTFVYGSRNVQLRLGGSFRKNYYDVNYYEMAVHDYLLNKIPKQFDDFVFYGEIYGPGIQDLTYGVKRGIMIAFFDIYDIKKGTYLDYFEAFAILEYLDLPAVPLLYCGTWSREIAERLACGNSKIDENTLREGVVIRPLVEREKPGFGRVILKMISQEYLTRKKGTENH